MAARQAFQRQIYFSHGWLPADSKKYPGQLDQILFHWAMEKCKNTILEWFNCPSWLDDDDDGDDC